MWKRKKSSTDAVKVHVSWTGGLYVDPDKLRKKIIQDLVSQELKKRQEELDDNRADEEP